MFVVVFFWFFWKFGGFLINLLIGRLYGEIALAKDVYTFTYKIVIFAVIYPSLLKVVVPAFMPLFTERLQQGEEEAWGLANTVANLLILCNVVMLCLGCLFTEKLVYTLAPGFDPSTRQAAAKMLRIMFPGIFAMNLCVMALAIQNAYKVFSYPAAGDAVQKILWAVAILAGTKVMGARVEVIACGFLLGCVFQIIVNLVGLRAKLRFYRPGLPLLSGSRLMREAITLGVFAGVGLLLSGVVIPASSAALLGVNIDPELAEFTGWLFLCGIYALQLWFRARERGGTMARFAALAAPLLLGILFARWRDLTSAFFQSYTKAGWFGNLELAKTIGNLPHIMLGQALAIAMLPYLCELASKKDWKAFGDVLTSTLRMLALIFIPMTVALSVLDSSIFQLIYDDGNWSEFDIMLGGTGLSFFIWGLVFFAIENALMQSFFSTQKVWWPTLLGIAAAVFHIVLMVGVVRWLGFDSPYEIYLATAASLPASRAFKNTILLVVTRFHVRILPFRSSVTFGVKLAVVTLAVWVGMRYPLRVTKRMTPLSGLTEHVVRVDTFNFEAKGWFSRDASELEIEHFIEAGDSVRVSGEIVPTRGMQADLDPVLLKVTKTGDAGAVDLGPALREWGIEGEAPAARAEGLLLHQFREEVVKSLRIAKVLPKKIYVQMHSYASAPSPERHFLGAAYRVSGRRSLLVFPPIVPRIERDLSVFALKGMPTISFRAKLIAPGEESDLVVAIEDQAGTLGETKIALPHDGAWHEIKVTPQPVGGGEMGKLRRLVLGDVSPISAEDIVSKLLQIDDLHAAMPGGEGIMVDDFEMSGTGWQGADSVGFVPNEGAAERALLLVCPDAEARRSFSDYDFSGCDTLSMKIKSDRDAALRVTFVDRHGREFAADPIGIEKSEKRKKHKLSLTSVKRDDGATIDPAQLAAMILKVDGEGTGWKMWVDSVEFRATRSGKTRLMFEAFKAARVVVPSFTGFVVFVLLVWAFRIEEGQQIFGWLKAHGLDKVLAKVRKRRSSPIDAELTEGCEATEETAPPTSSDEADDESSGAGEQPS